MMCTGSREQLRGSDSLAVTTAGLFGSLQWQAQAQLAHVIHMSHELLAYVDMTLSTWDSTLDMVGLQKLVPQLCHDLHVSRSCKMTDAPHADWRLQTGLTQEGHARHRHSTGSTTKCATHAQDELHSRGFAAVSAMHNANSAWGICSKQCDTEGVELADLFKHGKHGGAEEDGAMSIGLIVDADVKCSSRMV